MCFGGDVGSMRFGGDVGSMRFGGDSTRGGGKSSFFYEKEGGLFLRFVSLGVLCGVFVFR